MPSTRRYRRALTLAVVVCACVSVVAAGATVAASSSLGSDSGQQVSAVSQQALAADHQHAATGCIPEVRSAEFEQVGDVVDVELLLCNEGSVTIEGPGYRGTVNLSSDESGVVTLQLNTYLNGSDAISVSSDAVDEVRVKATGNGTFQPRSHLIVYRDGSGDVVDEVRFDMGIGGADDVRLWRAPRGAASELRTIEAISSSRENASQFDSRRRLENPDRSDTLAMATNETLVVAIEAQGLEGPMAEAEGTPLARFRKALQKTGATFLVEQTSETVPPERAPLTPDVLNSSATHLVPQPENDTYYLVIDTSRLWVERDGASGSRIHVGSNAGTGFVYRFAMGTGEVESNPPDNLRSADHTIYEPSYRFPRVREEPVVLPPDADERVLVRTILAPGSTVTVNVSGSVNRTLPRTVRGRDDSVFNEFAVPLDLSGVPNGTQFTIKFSDATTAAEHDGARLRGVVRRPEASLQVRDDPLTSQSLVVSSVHVSHASIVAVYAGDGSLVGTQAVESGVTEDVFVPLTLRNSEHSTYRVILYRDADRSRSLTDADERYRVGGLPVAATVAPSTPSTPTPTATATQTATPTRTPTATRTPFAMTTETHAQTTEATTPGFGVVSALLALGGSGLLARRIRRQM
ncbi:MAG: PGF-CTERM sorting domain-containing protein [Halopenitus sp.]